MKHIDLEFIQNDQSSTDDEMKEFKKQLVVKIEKFRSEINRTHSIYDYLMNAREKGILVPLSDAHQVENRESVDSRRQGKLDVAMSACDYHRMKIQ